MNKINVYIDGGTSFFLRLWEVVSGRTSPILNVIFKVSR